MHGDWRKRRPKTQVSLETVVPPLPTNILTKPDSIEFELKIEKLNEGIDEANRKIKELGEEFKARVTDFKSNAGPKDSVNKELRAYFDELKENKQQKQKIYDAVEKVQKKIDSMDADL
jgi:uncharacterized coiled-coil DUF342 family protein